ncbi:MAG: ArdC-like ssDNA-binding domain-containing protein, partial [Lachnospiraceae bacterium]|nr:ArdC-like ssDNA-binding domain-containing protein [Lachnospiraceae bacterium]
MEKQKTYPSQYEKVKQISEQLEQGILNLFDNDENFRQWLDTCSKFHNYSLNNTLLIAMQRPDATAVAGMTTWNKMGRKVTKGSKAIKILAPAPYKRKVEVDKVDPVTGSVVKNPDG